jgi:hypothetical protein
MAWQMAQQMELAPGGCCKRVWQFEQLTNMYMLVSVSERRRNVRTQKSLRRDYWQ